MADRIQQRRDTAARWAQFNPILLEGEIGYVLDDPNLYKIGDGVRAWNDLPLRGYTGTIAQVTGDNENAVMSQKATTNVIIDTANEIDGFNFDYDWTDGTFWPKTTVGSTYTPNRRVSTKWRTLLVSGIPAHSAIVLRKISYGEATDTVVCNMRNVVLEVISHLGQPEEIRKIYDEPVKLYVSTLISNTNTRVLVFDKGGMETLRMNSIQWTEFPFINLYYPSKNWIVGDKFDPIPRSVAVGYNSLLYLLKAGQTININRVNPGVDTPYFIVANASTLEILELLPPATTASYTATVDSYVAFSSTYAPISSGGTSVTIVGSQQAVASNNAAIASLNANLKKINSNVTLNTAWSADLNRFWNRTRGNPIAVTQRTTGFYNLPTDTEPRTHEFARLSEAIPVTPGEYIMVFSNGNGAQMTYFEANADGTMKTPCTFWLRGWIPSPQIVNQFNTYCIKIPVGVNYIGVGWMENEAAGVPGGKVAVYRPNETLMSMISERQYPTIKLLDFTTGVNRFINRSGEGGVANNWKISDFCKIPNTRSLLFSSDVMSIGINPAIGYILGWYDENYNFIGGLDNSSEFVRFGNYCWPIEIPETAVYFKLSIIVSSVGAKLYLENLEDLLNFSSVGEIAWRENFYLSRGSGMPTPISGNWMISEPLKINRNFDYLLSGLFVNGTVTSWMSMFKDKELTQVVKFYPSPSTSGTQNQYLLLKKGDIPAEANYIVFCTTVSGKPGGAYPANIEVKVNNKVADSDFLEAMGSGGSSSGDIIQVVVPKYLDIPIGRNTDVFIDGIVALPNDLKKYPLRLTGGLRGETTTVGDNQIRVNIASEKELGVNFIVYNDSDMQSINKQKTLTMRSILRNVGTGQQRNICISGDSLIDGTAASCEAFRLLNEDGDFVINQIGTRKASFGGQTYKHEGRGSWAWSTYINPVYENTEMAGKKNAFMIDGELNFQKYVQNNFPTLERKEIDYFVMALGTNDVTQGSYIPTDVQIQNIINNAKVFIDALLSADKGFPNCKIAIGMPGVGAPVFVTTQTSASIFRMAIQKLNQAYVDTFDNGKYHANVTCVMHGAYIDRYNSYPFEDAPISDYITNVNVRRWTNEVHPMSVGYQQWGRGYYGKLRAFLADKL